ncbi:ER lumen protein-retaining receptor 1 [Sorex araneus]|nr:ER lumen protein-retaining receptor 1 [Sorex araneus]
MIASLSYGCDGAGRPLQRGQLPAQPLSPAEILSVETGLRPLQRHRLRGGRGWQEGRCRWLWQRDRPSPALRTPPLTPQAPSGRPAERFGSGLRTPAGAGRGRRRAGLRPRGGASGVGPAPCRPPPFSRLRLGLQLPPRLPLPEAPPRSRAHPGPPPPLPCPAARPEQPPRGAAPRPPASLQPSPARSPTMNLFRFLGDLSHLLAIILLLLKIWKSRSCAGISGKSQVLFAVVFTARYLDLFTNYISLYNTCMKVVYIACSFTTVWMIYSKFKATYDGNHDTFRVEFLVVPTAVLAFLVNHDFTPLEILWTFSIYLESVAILPQLFMVSKTGEAETITSHYLFALGVYRTLYLFNWIWRYHFEGFFDLIAIVAGLVQTVLYCDFFYLYITKVLKGKKLSLPA